MKIVWYNYYLPCLSIQRDLFDHNSSESYVILTDPLDFLIAIKSKGVSDFVLEAFQSFLLQKSNQEFHEFFLFCLQLVVVLLKNLRIAIHFVLICY